MIKCKKRYIIHMMIYENKNDTRKLYKIVSSRTGQDSKNSLPEATSDAQLAEEFTDFFLQNINMIRQKFNMIEAYQPTRGHVPPLQKFSTINEHDLRDKIMKMPSKSCEIDIITPSLLKRVLDGYLSAITRVVNLSLDKGEFCTNWKTVIVKPLIKQMKKETVKSNYRPVCNLPFFSKVVQKCILDQLTKHCNNHSLLPDYQSAFWKFYGCETSLLKLVNGILWNMEKQLITAVITLDVLYYNHSLKSFVYYIFYINTIYIFTFTAIFLLYAF